MAGCLLPFDKELKKELNDAAETYHAFEPDCKKSKIRKDMLHMYLSEATTMKEFLRFRFFKKTAAERKAYYLGAERKARFYHGAWNVFPRDKFERFQLFSSFYRRDVVEIRFDEDGSEDTYRSFCEKHDRFVAKPSKGTKGIGVRFVTVQEAPTAAALHDLVGGDCLLEEVIDQGDELAVFHPSSVNTLRIVSGASEQGEIIPLFAMLRTGRGKSIVDNVGSGGIISWVDLSSGVVLSDGLCENDWFEVHPDTGVRFKGTQIPDWDKVCGIVKEAHSTFRQQRLIGWDFAWTKNGWDVVEVNPSPSFQSIQVLMGRGIRPEIEHAFGIGA